MEFHVLGPIRVLNDGVVLPLGPPKQRQLLGLLLAYANQVVSVDRIVEALWTSEQPQRAPSVVQVYISGLRKLLEPDRKPGATPRILITEPPGYVLRIEDDALDSSRFESLLGAAAAVADSDPATAQSLLDQALALWRGRPYEDLAYEEFAQASIHHLAELRLQAEELRNDLALSLGRHMSVLAVIEEQVATHPFHEPFWRQLMIALYRSGRQTDALRAYQRCRGALADVGTAPSAEMAALEHQILDRDAVLDLAPAPVQRRHNLPPSLSTFIGRQTTVDEVTELTRERRVVTLIGAGGVGKSRLALEVVRGPLQDTPDGVYLISLASVDSVEHVPSRIAAALGVQGADRVGDPVDTTIDLLSEDAIHLLVDNCEHLIPELSRMLTRFLEGCPGLHILATSRSPLRIEGEHLYPVPTLATERPSAGELSDAELLFIDRARLTGGATDATSLHGDRLDEVLRATAGIPLAIELAASRLAMMSVDQLAELLAAGTDVLAGGPEWPVQHHRTMQETLEWSYSLLDPGDRLFFNRLAVFRGGFTLQTATRLDKEFTQSVGDAVRRVGNLVSMSLISPTAGDRFVLLEPVRQFGLRNLTKDGSLEDSQRAHLGVFCEMFTPPDTVLLYPDSHDPHFFDQLPAETDNVVAAITWGLDHDPTRASALASTAEQGDLFGSSIHESLRWRRLALAADPSASPSKARLLAGAWLEAALSEGLTTAQVFLEELLATVAELDDELWSAVAVSRMGSMAGLRGDDELSYRLFLDAAGRLERCGHPEVAAPLNNCAGSMTRAGRYEEAAAAAERLGRTAAPDGLGERTRLVADLHLGKIAACRGDTGLASLQLTRARARKNVPFRPVGDELLLESHILILEGNLGAAETIATALVDEMAATGNLELHVEGLDQLSAIALAGGDSHRALKSSHEALTRIGRLGHQWLDFDSGALYGAALADSRPREAAELLGAIRATQRRERRSIRHMVETELGRASMVLSERLDAEVLGQAHRRGEAVSTGALIRTLLHDAEPVPV